MCGQYPGECPLHKLGGVFVRNNEEQVANDIELFVSIIIQRAVES